MRYNPQLFRSTGAIIRTTLLGLALVAGGGARATTQLRPGKSRVETVTLQLKWRHQFQFAGYYAAIDRGYYREAGLEVRLIESAPGIFPVDEVLAGRADYGVSNSDLLLRRNEGKPVVALAAIFQHSPLVLIALRRGGLLDLPDLYGKPIMMEPQTAELLAYLKDEGLDLAKLQLIPHTYKNAKLLNGEIGAISAYSTDEPYALRQAGVDFQLFTPRTGGIDFYGDVLFTTEAEIAAHPDRVRAFREATLRGWDYAMAHPQEIVELILKKYSQRLSREHLRYEAQQTALLMHPGLIESGHMNPGRWRHIADTYAQLGMLPADFPLDDFLYRPNPGPNLKPVYWVLAGLTALTIATLGWALPLWRLNRRLRDADAAKSRYLAFLTHEIRTPLSGMAGTLEFMKAEKLCPNLHNQVQMLEHSIQNLVQLVNNVLDFSKIEAGKVTLEFQAVEVEMFMRKLCGDFQHLAEAKGLHLRQEIDPAVPAVIITDSLRLRQILSNLLANAIKFTAAGSVTITVEPVATRQGVRIRFQVSDTGPGIPEDKLVTLFRPYQQGDESTARLFGGSGLGLSIARELARLLKGDITVCSTPEVGSTFTVEIEVQPFTEL